MVAQTAHDGQALLFNLDNHATLSDKTVYIHNIIRQRYPDIDRISIAKYDAGCDTLRTHVYSMDTTSPLTLYQAKLCDVPSLKELVDTRSTRVLNDLSIFSDTEKLHTRRILDNGFRSSYTVPLFHDRGLIGMLFFNSYKNNTFTEGEPVISRHDRPPAVDAIQCRIVPIQCA